MGADHVGSAVNRRQDLATARRYANNAAEVLDWIEAQPASVPDLASLSAHAQASALTSLAFIGLAENSSHLITMNRAVPS